MAKIAKIKAREILDSRGNPTVSVKITTDNGIVGCASVPSGASTGIHEALELRDGDPKRYAGKGVLKAVSNINGPIAKMLIGYEVTFQQDIDKMMIELDGSENKSKLGANAILGVSLACVNTGALVTKQPLYKYIRDVFDLDYLSYKLPYPTMNILNGGKHADNGLSIQEFMIIPQANKFNERVRYGVEVFGQLKKLLHKLGYSTLVGDEGGFAPRAGDNEKAIKLIIQAIKNAGFIPGKDVYLGIDFASSEFYDDKKKRYLIKNKDKKGLSGTQMIALIEKWQQKYPIKLIEDGLAEDDWDNWQTMTKKLGKRLSLVGDDFFVTNSKRLKDGIDKKAGNAILIKLNQIGSLSETIDCIELAKANNYKVIISHRSGETADTTIADLAVAVNADYIKTGSLSRSERVEKYNRLMEIEQELQ